MTRYLSRREALFSAAFLCLRGSPASAQQESTFSVDVKVVGLLATVTGKRGEIIRGLEKGDFEVLENGRPQAIRYFSRESDLPLTLGLLVDTSMSQQRVLNAERGASFRFLDQILREKQDQFFILQFDMALQMRQKLTSSRRQLDEALAFVDTPTRNELRAQVGGGTLLYDAVVNACQAVMKGRDGRKALVVLSDGVDTGSEASMADSIEAAQRADTLIYSILFSDSHAYGIGGANGRRALERMSRETGGVFFEVTKKAGIEQIFDVLQEELRSQYSLGYISDQPVRISEFRKIQLSVRQKGLTVHARDRYWARR
ncbi:MAG TPA: VWA domain-containing protein [Bryobacteraceae bacterium]|jgi:VWFA-related protein|nr:VWA domain-containing protein [Bryobacteraceae bacterium]